MADKISVSYDANVDDLKRKLDELIAKNQQLSNAANAAQKAMSGLNSSVSATNNAFNQSTTVINNYNNSVNTTNNSINQMNNSMRQTQREVQLFEKGLQNIAGKVAAAFTVQSIVQFGASVIDTTRKVELMQNRLAFVFGSVTGGREAFERLYDVSQKLGIGFQELGDGFAGFAIAAKMAGFSAKESEGMFTKVAIALRGAGANSLQTQRSFYALQQMLSKGVVAAEELRRQLGEALPGASDLMTKAYNRLHPAQQVTNLGFTKLLENGKIISSEILPEFARVLEETFAPAVAGKSGSLDASLTRVTNSWDRFKLALGEANFQSVISFTRELTETIDLLNLALTNERLNIFQKLGIAFQGMINPMAKDMLSAELEIEKLRNEQLRKQQAIVYALSGEYKNIGDASEASAIKIEMLNQKAASSQTAFNKLTLEQLEEKRESLAAELKDTEHLLSLGKAGTDQLRIKGKAYQMILDRMEEIRIKNKETEKQEGDAIAAAKERLALEETRLLKTAEGTTAYYNQLIKVIEARKDLVKLEKAKTPNQMGLDLAKLDKDLNKAKKMIQSFTPDMADIVEEGIYVPSVEAWEKLDKDNRKFVENQLELALTMAQRGVEITEEGTEARLIAERNLALQVAEIEKFKVNISSDSEELKASKVKLINNKLRSELKKLGIDYVEDQKEIQDRVLDVIQEANDLIERTEGDSYQRRIARSNQMFEDMARKIKEEMSKTKDFPTLEALKKKLKEVEDAGEKAASAITLNQAADMVSQIGGIYGELAKRQSVLYENEQNNLKKMLDQKLISEEEYERRSMEIKKKQFNQERQSAIISAIIDGASGIMKAIAAFQYWQIPLITALTAAQISTISAQQFPGFKDGVIDLKGPGSETSDSIPTRLSRGESVMTAEETKRYKPVLQAIRDGEFEAFVAKKYTGGIAMQRDTDSFAQNISNSFEMQTAELANLLRQNRKVAVKNVDELAKAINHRGTAHKVINRRTTR
jgi:tape measure domain-containing protein